MRKKRYNGNPVRSLAIGLVYIGIVTMAILGSGEPEFATLWIHRGAAISFAGAVMLIMSAIINPN